MTDLSETIAPKSDQLNADSILGGPITIKVTGVSRCAEPDQPIAINYEGDDGKPFKPCKTMRRLLMLVWGKEGAQYVGRSMRLYRDDKVQFGGLAVGGIRISHMSHIERDQVVLLTATRGNKKPITVKPLKDGPATPPGSPRTAETRSDAPTQPQTDQTAPTLAERVTRAVGVLGAAETAAALDAAWSKMTGLRTDASADSETIGRLTTAREARARELAAADEPADEPTY